MREKWENIPTSTPSVSETMRSRKLHYFNLFYLFLKLSRLKLNHPVYIFIIIKLCLSLSQQKAINSHTSIIIADDSIKQEKILA